MNARCAASFRTDYVSAREHCHRTREHDLFFLRQVLVMFVFALQPLGEGGRGDGDDSGGSSRLAARLMTCDLKPV